MSCDNELILEAAKGGDLSLVQSLDAKGAMPRFGIMGAAEGGHANIIDWYFGEYNESFMRDIRISASGALGAARGGHLNILKFFLKDNEDLVYADEKLLRAATKRGHKNVIDYLVECSA